MPASYKPRDVRVIEGGQDLALLGHPFGESRAAATRPAAA